MSSVWPEASPPKKLNCRLAKAREEEARVNDRCPQAEAEEFIRINCRLFPPAEQTAISASGQKSRLSRLPPNWLRPLLGSHFLSFLFASSTRIERTGRRADMKSDSQALLSSHCRHLCSRIPFVLRSTILVWVSKISHSHSISPFELEFSLAFG